ncbi:hypothetical protein [Paenibacillus dendritiformis]|uniref:hypothetical protein n=1 Tax=Paenibacillus dendritiformis TaxID=130049 RepID=UPI000DA879AD|nr:hypothetical protein [Paenibacillus dendritiformis]PZM64847.1 hypothetical protein DOE73_14910 [Paenibacillus dendritiformis]
MKWYEVFRAGRYEPQGDFSAEDIQQVVNNYDPSKFEAPVVIGHPKQDDPAFGWVAGVSRQGDKLLASFRQVVPEFAEAVNAGRYKKVSVRLRKTDDGWTLRHVGFLGAAAPAVDGLKPIEFGAEDQEGVQIDLEFAEQTKEDKSMPGDKEKEMREKLEREFAAEREKMKKQMEADFAAEREKAKKALERERDIHALMDEHKTKLSPALRSGLAEFLQQLPDEETVEFSADGKAVKQSPYAFFKAFVGNLPDKEALFTEFAKAQGGSKTADFTVGAGETVDEDRLELDKKARDFAEKNKVSYEEAVIAVSRG